MLRLTPLLPSLPSAAAMALVVTDNSGTLSSLVTVPYAEIATPTPASSEGPAGEHLSQRMY
jgi:hypothetical protein